jgi:hypothetical protein
LERSGWDGVSAERAITRYGSVGSWRLGLLIAFIFSGALTRFDTRRVQVVEEANAIGTAWLRLDLLPAAAQPKLRDTFRAYVE